MVATAAVAVAAVVVAVLVGVVLVVTLSFITFGRVSEVGNSAIGSSVSMRSITTIACVALEGRVKVGSNSTSPLRNRRHSVGGNLSGSDGSCSDCWRAVVMMSAPCGCRRKARSAPPLFLQSSVTNALLPGSHCAASSSRHTGPTAEGGKRSAG